MTLFWIAAAFVALAAVSAVAWPLLRPPKATRSRAAHDEQVFRDQLAELDRDVERGVLSEDEAKAARIEVSRRLLSAATERERIEGPGPAPRRVSRILAVILALAAPAGATALYFSMASPGYSDRPLEKRLAEARMRTSQTEVEEMVAAQGYDPQAEALAADPSLAEFTPLVGKLELAIATRPDDLQGARLLANSLKRLGRFSESWRAYGRVIEILGESATAEDYNVQVEVMIYAAAGFVSDDALAASEATAQKFGPSGVTLYVEGLHAAQRGDPSQAEAKWTEALQLEPGESPIAQAARQQLAALGDAGQAVEAPPGPNADDMRAAADMSAEDRQAMIESMVAGLEDRLRSEGGDVNEWVRLIRALNVLEQSEKAQAAYDEAVAIFTTDPTALAFLKEQALLSGLAVE